MAMPEKALKKNVIFHFLHNSIGAFCESVEAPSGDFSSELTKNNTILLAKPKKLLEPILFPLVKDFSKL